jgi:uncharacterized glyoxalase superfamily protein PhnB
MLPVMTEPVTPDFVPVGYAAVNPWVISRDTSAEIEFLGQVLGARERPGSRMLGPGGLIDHVEVELSGSVIMMFDAQPAWPARPAHLRVYVPDARAALGRAVAAGAEPVTEVTELFFGELVARFRDPQGHLWWIHQRVADLSPPELGRRLAEPGYQAAMAYVQQTAADALARDPG